MLYSPRGRSDDESGRSGPAPTQGSVVHGRLPCAVSRRGRGGDDRAPAGPERRGGAGRRGNGTFAVAAAEANPRLAVWAFDALASAVAECEKRATQVRDRFDTGVAWAESVPLPDASVDRVLCRAVLHHVADAPVAYAEFARILKPGGLLLLQAPCNFWGQSWGRSISEFYLLADDSHRRQYHQPADVITGLNDVGLFMRRADCWTYRLSDLSERQAAWVAQNGAAEQFNLQQHRGGAWSVDLYWVRIVATKG
ncbi:MAG: class I SAM-dependent methyltransferase [Tepidisphaeraceae bacterium]